MFCIFEHKRQGASFIMHNSPGHNVFLASDVAFPPRPLSTTCPAYSLSSGVRHTQTSLLPPLLIFQTTLLPYISCLFFHSSSGFSFTPSFPCGLKRGSLAIRTGAP